MLGERCADRIADVTASVAVAGMAYLHVWRFLIGFVPVMARPAISLRGGGTVRELRYFSLMASSIVVRRSDSGRSVGAAGGRWPRANANRWRCTVARAAAARSQAGLSRATSFAAVARGRYGCRVPLLIFQNARAREPCH